MTTEIVVRCHWHEDVNQWDAIGTYLVSDCGHDYITDCPPDDTGFEYCPFCGKPIEIHESDEEQYP